MRTGRPKEYTADTLVRIRGAAAHRINRGSLRQRVLNALIDELGGSATIGQLDSTLHENTMPAVRGLLRSGWLEVVSS